MQVTAKLTPNFMSYENSADPDQTAIPPRVLQNKYMKINLAKTFGKKSV